MYRWFTLFAHSTKSLYSTLSSHIHASSITARVAVGHVQRKTSNETHAHTSKQHRKPIRPKRQYTRIYLHLQSLNFQLFLRRWQAVVESQKFPPRARRACGSRADDKIRYSADLDRLDVVHVCVDGWFRVG